MAFTVIFFVARRLLPPSARSLGGQMIQSRLAQSRLAFVALLALLVLAAGLSGAALADQRIALVIGNSAYRNVARLPNPSNDAAAIGALFKSAGFDDVRVASDLGVADLRRELRDFSVKAAQADIAVLFYAGHGIEVGGRNYLIPVDAKLERDIDVEDETVDLDRILQLLDPAKRLKLVILDACRNNPFVPKMQRTIASRAVGRGLGQPEVQTSDTLVAYASRAGSTALDGDGTHSPFTAALLHHLTAPGLDLRIALGNVHDEVMQASHHEQEPFLYGALGGGTLALVPAKIEPPKPREEVDVAGRADFDLAKQIGTLAAWDAFLAHHPTGFLADLAKAERQKLADSRQDSWHPPSDQKPEKVPLPITPREEPQISALSPSDAPPGRQELYTLPGAAALVARTESSLAWEVVFSPDGKWIASAHKDNAIRLWDATRGTLVKALVGHKDGITSLAFSPDGRSIASGSNDKTVKLWDVTSGNLLQTFAGDDGAVNSVAFSPDGKSIASATYATTIKLWATSGTLLKSIDEASINSPRVMSVAFSPDGRKIASGSDQLVKLWDAASGRLLKSFKGHDKELPSVNSVAFSPDGRKVASGGVDNTIRLWDVAQGTLLRTFKGHGGAVQSVAFSPDGTKIASASDDKTIKLWETASGKVLTTLENNAEYSAGSVAFSRDGKRLAWTEGPIKLWDVARNALVATFFADGPDWAVVASDGRYVVSGNIRNLVTIKRGDQPLPMDEFIAKNRRDSLADVLSAAR